MPAAPTSESSAEPIAALRFRWQSKIRDIAGEWPECFGREDVLRSYALHQAVEDSHLEDVEMHYLVGTDERGVACIVPCFAFKTSLVSVATDWLQRIVARVRKVWPGFLTVRLFVVGTPVSTCSDLLGLKDISDPRRWNPASLSRLFDEIVAKSRTLGIKLVLIKEYETRMTDMIREPLAGRFFFVESLPTTYLDLPIPGPGGYFEAICSKYRNKLKKRKRVGAANHLTWEVVPTCRGYEDEIHRLYRQVLDHSRFVFERLNREFFVQIDRNLPGSSFFVLGFRMIDGVKRLVACELVVCDRTTMHPLYSGFDYWIKRDGDLYFNAFYTSIEEAERRGFSRLHLGQTAYEVKAELGAKCTKLFYGVHHTNPVMHVALWHARRFLAPSVTFPPRAVFAQSMEK